MVAAVNRFTRPSADELNRRFGEAVRAEALIWFKLEEAQQAFFDRFHTIDDDLQRAINTMRERVLVSSSWHFLETQNGVMA